MVRKFSILLIFVHYYYDQDSRLIGESLANGTVLREYVYLRGEPVALLEYETRPGWYFYVTDHLGTPQQLVDSRGAVVWQAAYLPYGEAKVLKATVQNNLRFPGQYFDAETGLHYNWNRSIWKWCENTFGILRGGNPEET